ncbi:hypothetical protein JKF63_07202 [Porcisia hertigi]|uniref:Uncharacterized protein n=1 Tax=Porcisia hertigi TaxID=2761500 RepID=A0A836YI21_9TRYP|nr:hypothetical protein JKF63_07202 [Porcisia hertigi]
MGPRVAGFLVGGFVAATASCVLLQYDVLRKQELTLGRMKEMGAQVDMIEHRFRVVEAGLHTLTKSDRVYSSAA